LPDLASVTIPFLAGVIAWIANEWRKRSIDERARREERYKRLIEYSRGFYVGGNRADIARFLDEVSLSWLYCPDDVIRALYAFLDSVGEGKIKDDDEKENAFGAMIAAMRLDLKNVGLWRRTGFAAKDYRHLGVHAYTTELPPKT
jgi:hypothetical protein